MFLQCRGFALNAAAAGASLAVGIDSSALAVEAATRNAELNGLTNCSFEKANVFDLLRDHLAEERAWDMIVLDPQSFAKHRGALRGALAGCAELNRTALSCSSPAASSLRHHAHNPLPSTTSWISSTVSPLVSDVACASSTAAHKHQTIPSSLQCPKPNI
ncbi:MAG: methyltransferase domain-containing protein [Ignavibacteria bacterium]|nr:methyltransferase domain-containing protein [Ignavibacteria bacterium]